MKHLVFNEKFSISVESTSTDIIESIEIKNNLFVVPKNVYMENRSAIDNLGLPFIIRKINKDEWIEPDSESLNPD